MASEDIDFGSFERETLADKVADRIIELIKERHLLPGDKLPTERELTEMMNVSRPVIRSALRALAVMKIVENRHRAGTYITSLKPELMIEHLELVFQLEDTTYMQLLQARKIVEPSLAALAAQNISEDEIRILDQCLEDSIKAIDDPIAFMNADVILHRTITDVAKNAILTSFMNSISKLGYHSRRRTTEIPEIRKKTIEDHQTIVAAIKQQDAQAASKAMLDHLTHVEERLADISNP